MTDKRFYLMNVEDPLHEYGRWCKAVLEDGETGKQYENALEVMDLLNEQHEENERLRKAIDNCQFRTLDLLDYIKEKKTVTHQEIKDWWNSKVKE